MVILWRENMKRTVAAAGVRAFVLLCDVRTAMSDVRLTPDCFDVARGVGPDADRGS